VEPRVLDATRCISYHTIESKAPIPDEIAKNLNGWAFGCDICNDVCPWNVRFAVPSEREEYRDRGALDLRDPGFFERMSPSDFDARFGDTPLERPGLAGMRRNWAGASRRLPILEGS
jgi:epoxyqueuosine reductase